MRVRKAKDAYRKTINKHLILETGVKCSHNSGRKRAVVITSRKVTFCSSLELFESNMKYRTFVNVRINYPNVSLIN